MANRNFHLLSEEFTQILLLLLPECTSDVTLSGAVRHDQRDLNKKNIGDLLKHKRNRECLWNFDYDTGNPPSFATRTWQDCLRMCVWALGIQSLLQGLTSIANEKIVLSAGEHCFKEALNCFRWCQNLGVEEGASQYVGIKPVMFLAFFSEAMTHLSLMFLHHVQFLYTDSLNAEQPLRADSSTQYAYMIGHADACFTLLLNASCPNDGGHLLLEAVEDQIDILGDFYMMHRTVRHTIDANGTFNASTDVRERVFNFFLCLAEKYKNVPRIKARAMLYETAGMRMAQRSTISLLYAKVMQSPNPVAVEHMNFAFVPADMYDDKNNSLFDFINSIKKNFDY